MTARLQRVTEVMKMVSDDCASDAAKLDTTPFTPKGMGESLGSILALIKACADSIAVIATELQERE